MVDLDETSKNLNFWLAVCWIAGVILAIVITMHEDSLKLISDEVLKWIGQVLVPICLLVLSRVFGLTLTRQFGAALNRKKVYWLTFAMSVVFIVFVINTIFAAADEDPGALGKPDGELRQLKALSSSGTTILIALIWPILSMLLDYLFPKPEPAAAGPDNAIAVPPPTAVDDGR